ncbi:nitrile hydratase accessory protein [Alphaproteobacteria bacterium]|nr:nitrile hydratase accessory protein [Alphaproteobacteria bacterium]
MINQNNFEFNSFEKPWHGQIFAITVSLSENKVFEWSEFSKALAEQIKMDKTEKQNGSDDYFFFMDKGIRKLNNQKRYCGSI